MSEEGSSRRSQREDKEVGRRVRTHRRELGLSQTELAKKVGLSFQQVQKYESGASRIGLGRLHEIATALGVKPSFFLEGGAAQAAPVPDGHDAPLTAEARALLSAFSGIAQDDIRRQVIDLVTSIAVLSRAMP